MRSRSKSASSKAKRKAPKKKAPKKKTPAKKKKTPAKKKKRVKALDDLVDLQKAALESFAEFFRGAADRAAKGDYTPSQWAEIYTTLWKDLARGGEKVTRKIVGSGNRSST